MNLRPGFPGGGFLCVAGAEVLGLEELAVLLAVIFTLCCLFHPISLVMPKETGWSPKEKRFWAGTDARTLVGPARLSHGPLAPVSDS